MSDVWWKNAEDLDGNQKRIFDLPLSESNLITGPPGSGKTNILLLRASQMVLSRKQNILIIVFTRTLREFVVTGGALYAFGADRIKTLNSWSFEFLREYGIKPVEDADFSKQRQQRIQQINEVIKNHKLSGQYDAVILDEAQDYWSDELDIFFQLGRTIFAAADSRQQIYVTSKTSAAGLANRFGEKVYSLKHHYRNGHRICQVADELGKAWADYEPLMKTSQYPEKKFPSTVNIYRCTDLSAQVAKALEEIETQLKAYPEDLLAILCPKPALRAVWQQIIKSPLNGIAIHQSAEDGYVPFEPGKALCVCTVFGAKGLEFRAAHLLNAEEIGKSPLRRNITYTAVTRAKTSLSFYHSKPLPHYLDSALNVIRSPAAPAKLEQLFGTV